ncbi:hypothetical protein CPB86DRAFT_80245 [Serendipita vermifera]|nr:hypothetical protein CPB86DRAFT_80245 [Serendipita vermifera]
MGRLTGNIPGGVLKTITEEHKCLGQFADLVKRRADLDRRYLDDLGQLFQFVDPAWSRSAIWPLVEPFLDNISNEVASRRETCEIVDTRIKALPKVSQSGLPMTKEYEELGKVFQEHEQCRTEASSLSSIAELKVWHGSEYNHNIFSALTTSDIQSFRLPESSKSRLMINFGSHSNLSDRLYRQSVLRQQQKSIKMSVWHSSVLPVSFIYVVRVNFLSFNHRIAWKITNNKAKI